MRGFSTKHNQVATKSPKLKSNDSLYGNSNRNLLKKSLRWLLKTCRSILFVLGAYLVVSFFYYFHDSTQHFINEDGKTTEVQITKTSDKINIISCSIIGNEELSLKAYRMKLFESLCCIIVCNIVCSIVIVIIDE